MYKKRNMPRTPKGQTPKPRGAQVGNSNKKGKVKTFVLEKNYLMLTYSTGFLPLRAILQCFIRHALPEVTDYNLFHEVGDETECEHTHFVVRIASPPGKIKADVFNIIGKGSDGKIRRHHPNIKQCMSPLMWANWWNYAFASKKDTPPVFQVKSGDCPVFDVDYFTLVKNAPDLKTACRYVGVKMKSVSDVVAVRRETAMRQPRYPAYRLEQFRLPDEIQECLTQNPDFHDNWHSIVLYGDARCGKTKLAEALIWRRTGKPSLVINTTLDLWQFSAARHGGVIYDDPNFNRLTINERKALVEWEDERNWKVLYATIEFPKEIPKIFCTNSTPEALFFSVNKGDDLAFNAEDKYAVYSRITVMCDIRREKPIILPGSVRDPSYQQGLMNPIGNTKNHNEDLEVVMNDPESEPEDDDEETLGDIMQLGRAVVV